MVIQVEKEILNTVKFHDGLVMLNRSYAYYVSHGTIVKLNFSRDIDDAERQVVFEYVEAFVNYSAVEQLTSYLDNYVQPFIKNLINTFAAENISMGITKAGKTIELLGIFEKPYRVEGAVRSASLKGAMDTGSLYAARSIIQHLRSVPSEYEGLDPFVTDARLLKMLNEIEGFLGIPLSR